MPSFERSLERLKKRADFVRATRAKNSAGMPGLVLQAVRRPVSDPNTLSDRTVRIGFTASRKVGNAVARNRAKRRLRALAEDVITRHAAEGHDYVLIARQSTVTRNFSALRADLVRSLKKLKLWQD